MSPCRSGDPFRSRQAGSAASTAASTDSRAAASATEAAIGPAVSWASETGTMPVRLTSPVVGLIPTIPHALDGQTIDPSVSVPTASGASPAATADPEPELDPDGFRPGPRGFTVWPPTVLQPLVEWVERKLAHSDRFALPRITAPASRSRVTRNASPDSVSSSAGEPAVAGIPAAWMLSLTSTGMPSGGPGRVAGLRLGRRGRADRDDRAQFRVEQPDPVEVEAGQRGRGERSGRERLLELADRRAGGGGGTGNDRRRVVGGRLHSGRIAGGARAGPALSKTTLGGADDGSAERRARGGAAGSA